MAGIPSMSLRSGPDEGADCADGKAMDAMRTHGAHETRMHTLSIEPLRPPKRSHFRPYRCVSCLDAYAVERRPSCLPACLPGAPVLCVRNVQLLVYTL